MAGARAGVQTTRVVWRLGILLVRVVGPLTGVDAFGINTVPPQVLVLRAARHKSCTGAWWRRRLSGRVRAHGRRRDRGRARRDGAEGTAYPRGKGIVISFRPVQILDGLRGETGSAEAAREGGKRASRARGRAGVGEWGQRAREGARARGAADARAGSRLVGGRGRGKRARGRARRGDGGVGKGEGRALRRGRAPRDRGPQRTSLLSETPASATQASTTATKARKASMPRHCGERVGRGMSWPGVHAALAPPGRRVTIATMLGDSGVGQSPAITGDGGASRAWRRVGGGRGEGWGWGVGGSGGVAARTPPRGGAGGGVRPVASGCANTGSPGGGIRYRYMQFPNTG